MKKKLIILLLGLVLLVGCKEKEVIEERYRHTFFDTFDTVVTTIVYAKDQEEADKYNKYIEERFIVLHKEFDKYKNYDGVNNVKTINDNAGLKPIKVSDDLYGLIEKSIEWYYEYSDNTDISFGKVLNIWSEYRDLSDTHVLGGEIIASVNTDTDKLLPTIEELEVANQYTGIEHIVLDKENKTVFIDNPNTQIDVGAVAKGYAVELVSGELELMGCDSALISAGGNVKAIGKPHDGIRANWGIGLQNPDILYPSENQSNILDTVFVHDLTVVASGDYQRFFVVDGKVYHHLIDKKTLFPGDYFRAVHVIYEDSGIADFLSTAIFLMPLEEGRELIESIEGAEALWMLHDGQIIQTPGLEKMLKSKGATGAK